MTSKIASSRCVLTTASPESLRTLESLNATSRHELRCFADSWTEHILGRPLSRSDREWPCVYTFAIPGLDLVKVGSTIHPWKRRLEIRTHCRVKFGWDHEVCGHGDIDWLEPMASIAMARKVEDRVLTMLRPHSCTLLGSAKRRPVDWFHVSRETAAGATVAAWATENGHFLGKPAWELFDYFQHDSSRSRHCDQISCCQMS